MRSLKLVVSLTILLCLSTLAAMAIPPTHPKYLFLNRTPGPDWYQDNPERISDALLKEPFRAIGSGVDGAFVVGQSFVFSCLNGPTDRMQATLKQILAASRRTKVPVLIVLDCQNWWDYRSDLWNWWDPKRAGYNPANVNNVEWTGPGPEHAIKGAWRNWGRQIRVVPPPNLNSPAFRKACREAMLPMLSMLTSWQKELGPEEQYRFPGVKLGWETSVGINAYVYPDAEKLLANADASKDPTEGPVMSKGLFGGLLPQGYSALASANGGKRPASEITVNDAEAIASGYLAYLCSLAADVGLDRKHVFTHAGGQYAPYPLHVSHRTALNAHSTPGWSLYFTMPQKAGDLEAVLQKSGQDDWCAAEWLPAAQKASEWKQWVLGTLEYRNCRFISLYNWEGIKNNSEALQGIEQARTSVKQN